MTVPTLNSLAEFATNGVTTNYPFFFKFLSNEDLVVTYVNPDGVSSTLVLGTQYIVNGAGDDSGGSIVTTSTLAGPGQLIVSREMAAYQQTSLRNQGKFLAETHEDVFDRLTMLIQQGYSQIGRALLRPFGKDYFYAEDRLIKSLKDPVDVQDAATMGWASRYFGDLIDSVTGLVNTTTGIAYDSMTLYDYLKIGVGRTVDSIAALRLLSGARNQRAFVLGYYQKGDGGGGSYFADMADTTSADNDGSIIVGTDGTRWKLTWTSQISAEQFGARGNGINSDSAAIQKLLVAAEGRTARLSDGKTYVLDVAVLIRSNTVLDATGATIKRGAAIDNMLRNYSAGIVGGHLASSNIQVIGGDWDANGSVFTSACTAIAFGHATNIKIRDATIRKIPGWHHIEVNSVNGADISNCRFYDGAEQANAAMEAVQVDLNVDGTQFPWFGPADSVMCRDIHVHHCYFENVGVAMGTHSFNGGINHNNIRFTHNTVINPYYAAVSALNWSDTKIINNRVEGGYYGIIILTSGTSSSRNHVISDNSFYNIGSTAYVGSVARSIYLSSSDGTGTNRVSNFTITGNCILDMVTAGKSNDGIHVNYADKGVISGNTINNTIGHGIALFSCTRVSIQTNQSNANNSTAGGFASVEVNGCTSVNIGGNTFENARLFSSSLCIARNNILSIAGSFYNTGNTNTTISENLIGTVFA